jgi:hypothetical protein
MGLLIEAEAGAVNYRSLGHGTERLSQVTAAGVVWWAFIGVAGAAHIVSGTEPWQKVLGAAALLLATFGMAVFAAASHSYWGSPAPGVGVTEETDLAAREDAARVVPEVKIA